MKVYACTISLLLCVMAYFALSVQGYLPATCEYDGVIYSEGSYTLPECYSQLICDSHGRVTIKNCPVTSCPHGSSVYSVRRGSGSYFPECCRKIECWVPRRFQNIGK